MTLVRQTAAARSTLLQVYPWIGKAVHTRWRVRRSIYQQEAQELLIALGRTNGHVPHALSLRLHSFLARLHGEWFPLGWRTNPTPAEVVGDFQWWLSVAERWGEPQIKKKPARRSNGRKRAALADQPARLLRLLRLTEGCTQVEFLAAWRRFLKSNHPDLNPEQSADERRRFKEAVALWRR